MLFTREANLKGRPSTSIECPEVAQRTLVVNRWQLKYEICGSRSKRKRKPHMFTFPGGVHTTQGRQTLYASQSCISTEVMLHLPIEQDRQAVSL